MATVTLFTAPPTRLRSDVERSAPQGVDRDGGDDGFGAIRGLSVIARGEAIGHRMFVDRVMLEQVVEQINAPEILGVKSRFAHPDMSGDGIGTGLGRIKNASIGPSGDNVIADLHFSAASTKTPDGDLADYLMTLAEGEPDHFGFSISFKPDIIAEQKFISENKKEVEVINPDGSKERQWIFQSPDEKNENNLPHVRLKKLHAGDAVDSPAANANGLFYSENDVLEAAEKGLSYLFGLSEEQPDAHAFGVDAERAKGFFIRFLDSHGLKVVDVDAEDESTTHHNPDITVTDEQLTALADDLKGVKGNIAELKSILSKDAPKDDPPAPAEDEPNAPEQLSREDALRSLGITSEQFEAMQSAQAKAKEDAEEKRLAGIVQKQFDLMGLKARPGSPAADDPKSGKDDEPATWSQAVEGDKALAKGLSFADEWSRGEINLSNLPDNQDAFILLHRAEKRFGREEAFSQE